MNNKTMKLLFALITFFSTSLFAETYRFDFSNSAPPMKPQTKFVGNLMINGVTLPAYNSYIVRSEDHNNEVIEFPVQAISSKVKSAQLNQLSLYGTLRGTLFIPRNWVLSHQGIGDNGSMSFTFQPKKGEGFLTYRDTSACMSCAISSASVMFPEARREAIENDSFYYDSVYPEIKSIRMKNNNHIMTYRVEEGQKRLDGVAYYNLSDDLPHWRVELYLPESQRDLATPILNQFVINPR